MTAAHVAPTLSGMSKVFGCLCMACALAAHLLSGHAEPEVPHESHAQVLPMSVTVAAVTSSHVATTVWSYTLRR